MKSQHLVLIIFVILSISENKVWGASMDADLKVWEPSLDTFLIKFKKKLSGLDFEPICSDCDPDDLLKMFQEKNEDIHLSGFQLLTKYGLEYIVYIVTTCDGYSLKFVRVPGKGPPILINHGLMSSFVDFFTSGTTSGLGYILHKAGYDLWFTNCRGNTFSRNHTTLSPEDKEFWDFSWHEIGTRDLPAFIDFALCKTGKKQLIYIGHSQGTTAVMVLLSEKPEYNKKLKLVIMLSAVAFMGRAKNPILRALSPFSDEIQFISNLFGWYEILPRDSFIVAVKDIVCYPPMTVLCSNIVFLMNGFDFAQLNHTALPVQYSHGPSGAAVKQYLHYMQEINSKKFRQYDHGTENNLIIYGSEEPPDYKLKNIRAPVAIFRGANDWFADPRDVKKLVKILPNVVKDYLVPFDKFNHLDFIWAKDAKKLLFDEVLELIEEYENC